MEVDTVVVPMQMLALGLMVGYPVSNRDVVVSDCFNGHQLNGKIPPSLLVRHGNNLA